MTWTKLSDDFWSHPKIVGLGNEGAGAFCRMLSYCGQHNTDGQVPKNVAAFIAKPGLLSRLSAVGLVEEKTSCWLIPDYLDYNPTRAELLEISRKRAAAGRKGGRAKASKG